MQQGGMVTAHVLKPIALPKHVLGYFSKRKLVGGCNGICVSE